MSDIGGLSPELRDRIFEAARAELLESGIDRFRIDGVARRAGVDRNVIVAQWHDRRVLLNEAMLARTTASMWSRDTGSLYTDLETVSALAVEISQTAEGRALFRRLLPDDKNVDLAEICSDVWDARFRDAGRILQRAADRGQLRDGVEPSDAIRMFAAAFYYDVIFADSPVRPDYAAGVVDVFLHGILGAGGRDRPWPAVEDLFRHVDTTADGSAVDSAVEMARRAVVLTRAWADALTDPLVLLEAVRDEHGHIEDFVFRQANRACCERAGMGRTELLGRSVLETLPGFRASGLLERYTDCVNGGGALVLNDFEYPNFDRRRRWDIRAESAAAELITATWRDVTDRYEAAQIDQRYRKLMDFSAVPAALATPDGRLVSVNQALASMLGYDIGTLLTLTWQDLTAPETIEQEEDVVAEIMARRRDSYRVVKQYVHADGHRVWGDLSLSCIRRPDGEVEHLIAQIVDISEFRKAARW